MPDVTTIILTGGAATRMRPLSLDKPKSMISFMGKPLLCHLTRVLRSQGFSDVVFTSLGKGRIKEYFTDGKNFGLNIRYYRGQKWLGTAGIVKNVIEEMNLSSSNTFMIIYGDSLLKADYKALLAFHQKKRAKCTVLYHRPDFASFLYDSHDGRLPRNGERTNFGVLDVDAKNRISNYRVSYYEEKPLLQTIKEKFTNPVANATVYVFERELLDHIPSGRSYEFVWDLFPELADQNMPLYGFDIGDGYREDIGTISNYFNTQFDILTGRLDFEFYCPLLRDGVWVGEDCAIDSSDMLTPPVLIGDGCILHSNARIEHSIVGSNVQIGKSSQITHSIILDGAHIGDESKVSYCIIGECSSIGDRLQVPVNTVLGSFCHLGDSKLYGSGPST